MLVSFSDEMGAAAYHVADGRKKLRQQGGRITFRVRFHHANKFTGEAMKSLVRHLRWPFSRMRKKRIMRKKPLGWRLGRRRLHQLRVRHERRRRFTLKFGVAVARSEISACAAYFHSFPQQLQPLRFSRANNSRRFPLGYSRSNQLCKILQRLIPGL